MRSTPLPDCAVGVARRRLSAGSVCDAPQIARTPARCRTAARGDMNFRCAIATSTCIE